MIYEHYRAGQLVERVQPEPGKYDDTRIGLERLERIGTGERDGWYAAGEWAAAEAERQAVQDSTVDEVLAEVGDDPVKAAEALAAERASAKPRTTLTTELAQRAGED